MATVIVEVQLRVVEDGAVKKLWETTMSTANDLVEIPELQEVCMHDIIGLTRGQQALNLDIEELKNRICVAAGGVPTAVIFVRKGDPIIELKNLN